MKEILEAAEKEILKRGISEEQVAEILKRNKDVISRRIIGGLSSVSIVDRENQKIPISALKKAAERFMQNIFARNCMVFHSDIQCGRVLPFWTNPETGETLRTEVNALGWYTLVEIRDDIEIANKVWGEILKGNIRSFSIAGSSKEKLQKQENGVSFEQINDLDLYETTLCFPDPVKIWTKRGLISIKDVVINDYVYTHKNKWQKVLKTFSRSVNEDLIKITTEFGELLGTKNHPIRILQGKNKKASSLNYRWVKIEDVKIQDLVSYHKVFGYCEYCGAPIFSKLNKYPCRNFCSIECRRKTSGNRLGSHYISKLRGVTKKENPNLSGGIKTIEGKKKNKLAHQTLEFRATRSKIQTKLWKDAEYATRQCLLQRRRPNKTETLIQNIFDINFPNEWKYVGDGKFWIEGKNPDFININGKKKIIEFNGVYWHKDQTPIDRIEHFKKYGYETLILDDLDIKKDLLCIEKVKEFSLNSLSRVIKIETINYSGLVYNLEVAEDNSYTTEIAVVHNCETPVCSEAKFSVLWNPQKIEI